LRSWEKTVSTTTKNFGIVNIIVTDKFCDEEIIDAV
jgi:hypothetical protein